MMSDPITEDDLASYVDGQIDTIRRLEVEAHLARNPDAAAEVMAALHDRDALREAFARAPGPGPDRLFVAARRFDRGLRWDRFAGRLKRAAAIAVLVGAGWLAHSEVGEFGVPGTIAATVDPVVIADAKKARETARLRAAIASQRSAVYDKAGIEAATGVALPTLPEGWSVRDVQVFPGRTGPGIEMAIDAGSLGEIALFATHSRSEGHPGEVASAGEGGVYWTARGAAYTLSGGGDPEALARAAEHLATAAAEPAKLSSAR
ncbi:MULTISPECIES: anti-sigma factor [unclassified Methylobacterium]|uniref:anti-sigma factor family protein n=2 Tax=Methylobacterium TaxID=407 RepID=UPI000CC0D646|nr:anti-sigma factor [Methylobacterium sp.]PIU06571.1 MAG: anti-sigma factor [Methylobacterium sp. CG09_land_8_20_14_0_10_71_15]PIU14147.1 MAG: anti-sigma factor [Methylobacterium sp. CG08_land_8_20_14_0_20_71_15]GBU19658.1 hypothetical protein AwMethylo_38730 [Methylobacterium sp.]